MSSDANEITSLIKAIMLSQQTNVWLCGRRSLHVM